MGAGRLGLGARIGVLTPHADIAPEAEFRAMAPDGIAYRRPAFPWGLCRGGEMDPTIAMIRARALADPHLVDDAAELLPTLFFGDGSSWGLDLVRSKPRRELSPRGLLY